MTTMLVAEEKALRGESHWGLADTQAWWYGLSGFGETWIVEDERASIIGVLGIFQRGDHFNCWIAVDRSHPPQGLRRALLAYAEERVAARGGRSLNVDAFAEDHAAEKLFVEAGYVENDRHVRMQIDLDLQPPEAEWPLGVRCLVFDPEQDARDAYNTIGEAFGHMRMPFDDWLRYHVNAPDFDPTLWFVAHDGNETVGVIRGDAKRWGGGWVGMLAVRPNWQGRSIGTALLHRSFREFYDRGERRVGLDVDAGGRAKQLYERLGMRAEAETVTYKKDLA